MQIANLFSGMRHLVVAGLTGAGLTALMAWSAGAVSPIMQGPNIQWAGGVPSMGVNSSSGYSLVYPVPTGLNFMVTDLIVSNANTTAATVALIDSATASCYNSFATRMGGLVVSPTGTLVVPLNTGFGFGSGRYICVHSTSANVSAGAKSGDICSGPARPPEGTLANPPASRRAARRASSPQTAVTGG